MSSLAELSADENRVDVPNSGGKQIKRNGAMKIVYSGN